MHPGNKKTHWTSATGYKNFNRVCLHFRKSKPNSQNIDWNNSQIQHLNGNFIMLTIKLQWGELCIVSVYCYSLPIQNSKGQGSQTPLFIVNLHINFFIHSSSSKIPSLSSHFYCFPSLLLLASPFLHPFFTISLISFNGILLEGQQPQLFVSSSIVPQDKIK